MSDAPTYEEMLAWLQSNVTTARAWQQDRERIDWIESRAFVEITRTAAGHVECLSGDGHMTESVDVRADSVREAIDKARCA